MPTKKKKFIDKKKAVTFTLVHRSQQDPLIADERAPKHVLLPKKNLKKQKEEEHKFGVYFDDEYNYLQHLKDTNESSGELLETFRIVNEDFKPPSSFDVKSVGISLPSSVFPSEVEEEVGLLNKAAPDRGPKLDWDPEIVAALDDDFDFEDPENELEDDFVLKAIAKDAQADDAAGFHPSIEILNEDGSDVLSDVADDNSDLGSLGGTQYTFATEETKSRFTEYSLTSSVVPRSEQLSILDDKFEDFFAEYSDDEVGALDCTDIDGVVDPRDVFLNCAKELVNYKVSTKELSENVADAKNCINVDHLSDEEMEEVEVPAEKEQWDCESILSTYSNKYNHPGIITEPVKLKPIHVNRKTGIPEDVLKRGLTKSALEQLDQETRIVDEDAFSVQSRLSVISLRDKNETPEEKKDRKKAVKEYRRDRRIERKANTQAFKEEKIKQEKSFVNSRKNIQGVRIL